MKTVLVILIILAAMAAIAFVVVRNRQAAKRTKSLRAAAIAETERFVAETRRVQAQRAVAPKRVSSNTPVNYSGGVAKPVRKGQETNYGYVDSDPVDTTVFGNSGYSSGGYICGDYSSGKTDSGYSGSSYSSDTGSSSASNSDSGSAGGGCD